MQKIEQYCCAVTWPEHELFSRNLLRNIASVWVEQIGSYRKAPWNFQQQQAQRTRDFSENMRKRKNKEALQLEVIYY